MLTSNLRLAVRTLLKTPVVTAVAVVSLALGIGCNAAIFSLFHQVLIRPLPVSAPGELVNLEAPGPKPGADSCTVAGGCDEVFSYPMFRDLARVQTVFTELVAHRSFFANVAYAGRTLAGAGMGVSGAYFPTLGLRPVAGRLLGPEDDEPVNGHPVAVLSHELWEHELGGSPDVVGEAIIVNGEPLTIVGVAPEGFTGTTLSTRPLIFVPVTLDMVVGDADRYADRRAYWLYLFGRLRPAVSMTQARAVLEPQYRNILADVEAPLQVDMSAATMARFLDKPLPMRDGRRGQSVLDEDGRAPLLLLFGVTAFVLLIACANIANLQLARAAARAPEIAVRLSIGAARRHLWAQLLTESCLLALVGGLAGLVVARGTLRGVGTFLPPDAVQSVVLSLEPGVVVFALALSLATGVVFGVYPALHGTRVDLITTLKDHAGQPSGGHGATRVRQGLVMAQIALAMTLLVGAGLCLESLRNVTRVDLGIRTDDVVTFQVLPALSGYDGARRHALYDRIETDLAAQPGVRAVGAASVAVFAGNSWGTSVMVEGFAAGPDIDRGTSFNRVGPGYFRTLGIPLLAGRDFTVSDAGETPRVAIVNEAFARKFGLGPAAAVGRRLGRGGLDAALDTEIVGLVRNARYNDVRNPEPPLLYVPYRQETEVGGLTFYARTAMPPEGLLRTVPALVAGIDPELPVNDLKTLPQQVRENIALERALSLLAAAFAVLATVLASVGLYGVLAYTVAQRTREIGLRMALGADARRVHRLVLGDVGRMALVGGAAGLAASVGLARLAQSMLFGVEGLPPLVLAAAAAALGLVALGAGLVPASRASRIKPMAALRDG